MKLTTTTIISSAVFALSTMMILMGGSEASLRNIHHSIFTKDQYNHDHDQEHDSSTGKMTIHRKAEEDDAIDVNSLVDFLVSEECSDFVESVNEKVEQFLNDHDDEEIIEKACSDEGVGKILRKEFELEASFDPDAPLLTCESAYIALLVQEKDDVLGVIVDPEECKSEVQSELGGIHHSHRALEATGRGGNMDLTTSRDLPAIIIFLPPIIIIVIW